MVELKQLEVRDIPQILKLDNEVEKIMKVELGEWVQWLTQVTNNEYSSIMVIGGYIENELKMYMVVSDMKVPPIKNTINIVYAFSKENHFKNIEFFNQFLEWVREFEYDFIEIMTEDTEKFKKNFGFTESDKKLMYYKVGN